MKKLPAVIIYQQTQDGGQELRYTLRGLKNISNWNGTVFIVGDRESWFSDKVNYIEMKRCAGRKHRDVYAKIRKIIETPEIAEDFIFLNDDFFVTKKIEIGAMNQGPLKRYIGRSAWLATKSRTRNILKNKFNVEEPLDYSIHTPIIFNKDKLLQTLEACEAQHPDFEISLRSMYGNMHAIGGAFYKDGKFKWDKPITSTGSSNDLGYIAPLLPEASEFEGDTQNRAKYTLAVLMTLYNEADRVEKAIKSIPDNVSEIICYDDGSTDDTRKILQRLANVDGRIRVYYSKQNKGIGYGVNKCYDKVTADYHMRLDGDDWLLPDASRLVDELDGSDVIFYGQEFSSGKIRHITAQNYRNHKGTIKIIRTEFGKDVRADNVRIHEDQEHYKRLLAKNPTLKFTNIIAMMRVYPRVGSLLWHEAQQKKEDAK